MTVILSYLIGNTINNNMEKADKTFISEVVGIFGRENVSTDIEDRTCHAYDSMKKNALPDIVVRAENAKQISQLMALANSHLVPVYPQGARSGLVGGAVPVEGGIALDLVRMRKILELDAKNLTATVEPGVVVADLQKEAAKHGLFYPPDPASNEFSTIGGNVAQCAGGLRCLKYGTTRDYVIALEVVLPNGEIIHTGAKTFKSSTGYNLTGILVGSEGTLGIFTKITVKLLPMPVSVATALAYFHETTGATAAVSEIVAMKLVPRALEFMDEQTVKSVQTHQDFDIPEGTGAVLLIEFDGDGEIAERDLTKALGICEAQGAFRVFRAADERQREEVWTLRRSISPALYSLSPKGKINEDVCVPRSRLSELLEKVQKISAERNVRMVCFGHAGDGTVHVNALVDLTNPEEKTRGEAAVEEVFRAVVKMGGVLSGEHGIGIAKMKYMPLQFPEAELALMRGLKKVFDPNNILNPGKIFPPEEANR
ncbi:MAG: FAD-linked oxidase C-terminal domain-containing protein [Planctomycetota bacterium]